MSQATDRAIARRILAAVQRGQPVAPQTVAAARRVLAGQATADDVGVARRWVSGQAGQQPALGAPVQAGAAPPRFNPPRDAAGRFLPKGSVGYMRAREAFERGELPEPDRKSVV